MFNNKKENMFNNKKVVYVSVLIFEIFSLYIKKNNFKSNDFNIFH